LVSNEFSLYDKNFITLYKKRWSEEEYHKNLKQNKAIVKLPTRTVRTKSNDLFSAILAYVKMEKLEFTQHLNHFAIKSRIFLAFAKIVFIKLNALKVKGPVA